MGKIRPGLMVFSAPALICKYLNDITKKSSNYAKQLCGCNYYFIMELSWTYKYFDELLPAELYAVMQLRNEVFVVEQNCVYQDADEKDLQGYHLLGCDGARLVAYTRLLPPGLAYTEASIGRVVTSPAYRGTGAGRQLMELSISRTMEQFGVKAIKIGAQLYLQKFYQSLGFVQCGPGYLEDNIPHIPMLLQK
jgi:ElaA protein